MKRYDEDCNGDDHYMSESEDGEWVRHVDVVELEERTAKLEGLLRIAVDHMDCEEWEDWREQCKQAGVS